MQRMIVFLTVILSYLGCVAPVNAAPERLPRAALVVASSLNGRSTPDPGGRIVAAYSFGMPLWLTERSAKTSVIDGVEAHWYRERTSGGWFFGGYLLFSLNEEKDCGYLKPDWFLVNAAFGGIATFNRYLYHGLFFTQIAYSMYPGTNDGDALTYGVVVGRYSRSANGSLAFTPRWTGQYTTSGKWIRRDEAAQAGSLRRMRDAKGVYYWNPEGIMQEFNGIKIKPFDRENAARIRARSSNSDKVTADNLVIEIYHTWIPCPDAALRSLFPLVR